MALLSTRQRWGARQDGGLHVSVWMIKQNHRFFMGGVEVV